MIIVYLNYSFSVYRVTTWKISSKRLWSGIRTSHQTDKKVMINKTGSRENLARLSVR